jgi:hypothetical protein
MPTLTNQGWGTRRREKQEEKLNAEGAEGWEARRVDRRGILCCAQDDECASVRSICFAQGTQVQRLVLGETRRVGQGV